MVAGTLRLRHARACADGRAAATLSTVKDLSQIFVRVRGVPVASLAELQQFAYAVPEHLAPPSVLIRITAGEEVPLDELARAVCEEGPKDLEASSERDAGLEALRAIRERLEAAFPELDVTEV